MRNTLRHTTQAGVRLHLGLAAVAYLPLLATQPGWVSADTKTYLFIDPRNLLRESWSMWDPRVGLGTVTHQRIGFIWPMGPFFWMTDLVGLPDWVAQRLWWGTIIFAAGAGVAYLLGVLGWRGPGVTAAVFVYALSPFVLTLVARLSGILLPFAGLPWMLALMIQALRHRGWRYPALLALAVASFGSVNFTALALVATAPVLWAAYTVFGAREVSLRQAAATVARCAALAVPLNLWWIAGLSVQSSNGIEILRYTETPKVVASTSVSHEVLRGLGYWFFYGEDRLGPWIEPSVSYTEWEPLVAISYLVPILGLAGAVLARWRHRAFFVLLVPFGTALAVGAYPWDDNYLFGRAVQLFQGTDAGLALRSLPRAVPLVALGMAVLFGGGVASLVRRWPRWRRPAAWGAVALALLALPPLWLGDVVPGNLRRHEDIPGYWQEAADHLDQRDDGTRVLVVPGSDFASYRWGNTVDPILPGLMQRPSVQRELAPYGSPASAHLLNAFDLRLQERTLDPGSLAAIARMLRAGDVLLISEWQYERYNTPRPRNLWDFVTNSPGLGQPTGFGPGEHNATIEDVQLDDELLFHTDPTIPDPPELAALPVDDPVGIVSTHPASQPLLVAGDASGLIDAAAAGLIDGTELIHYTASLDADQIAEAVAEDDAVLLLTDSNRKRGERWTTLRHNRGYTETEDSGPLAEDLTDNRLPVFPDAGTDTQTVTVRQGDVSAEATSYGNPITFTPEERPMLAVDGEPRSAWRTAAFSDARGERLDLTLSAPSTTDRVRLVQPPGSASRFITAVRFRFDDGDPVDVLLSDQSRNLPGQVIVFGERTFSELSIEILADSAGYVPRYAGQTSLGFAEVEIGAVPNAKGANEAVRLPTDLLDAAGTDSHDQPLAIAMTRQRQDPTDTTRADDESALVRLFTLPTARSFDLSGTARLSARAAPQVIDRLLGRPHGESVPWVRAGSELGGSVNTPAAVFDGDPTTIWQTVRSRPTGQWVEVTLPQETTIERLPVSFVADGLHSLPTEVELWVDGAPVERIELPDLEEGDRQNDVATVELDIDPITGTRFRVKITDVRERTTMDWNSDREIDQPAAIAEVGLPGPTVPVLPETFDSGCRADLLTVDEYPLWVRITGPMADALAGRPLDLELCESDSALHLPAGDRIFESLPGIDTGIDIDQLVLRSAAGGAASASTETLVAETRAAESAAEEVLAAALASADPGTAAAGDAAPRQPGEQSEQPTIEIVGQDLDKVQVRVSGADPDTPFWLVLGQSFNEGWVAQVEGADAPEGQLVDGFANGWRIEPPGETFEVELRFTPQRRVDGALWISALAAVACLALALRRARPGVVMASTAAPRTFDPGDMLRYQGARPARRPVAVLAISLGIAGWALAGPVVGVVVLAASVAAARTARGRPLVLAAAVASLGLCAAYVLYIDLRHSPQASFDWPFEMRRVHPLGWLAILLPVADIAVGRLWHRTPASSASTEPQLAEPETETTEAEPETEPETVPD